MKSGKKQKTRRAQPTSDTRTFGGRLYRLSGTMMLKAEAEALAKSARKHGIHYRVIRTPVRASTKSYNISRSL